MDLCGHYVLESSLARSRWRHSMTICSTGHVPHLRLSSKSVAELRECSLSTVAHPAALRHLASDLETVRHEVERGRRFCVLELGDDWPVHTIPSAIAIIAGRLGDVLPQDSQGTRGIYVWDRDETRKMADGARYHQTHEGGSIHTDNVNQPRIWDYLVFGCIAGSYAGGETILVDARDVHDVLQTKYPDALNVLRGDFVWEYRGIKDDLYVAPVITYSDRGECQFRYLRPYLESAHQKARTPLTHAQVRALDLLDAVLQLSTLQIRFTLTPGQILITRDCQVLHGRTPFVDAPDAVSIDEAQPNMPLKRTLVRYWVAKNAEREEA